MSELIQTERTHLVWIDNVKAVATIAVVGIHVAAYGVASEYDLHGQANANWWASNFYESLFRCSVPLFVMLTGALVLPQQMRVDRFLFKRFNRILYPFLFWFVIYLNYGLLLHIRDEGFGSANELGTWIFEQVLKGPEYHLWYVYMLFGLYLFIPILQPWLRSASNRNVRYFLSIWIIVLMLKQFNLPADTAFDLRYFSGYAGYLILGYYLSSRRKVTSNLRAIAILMLVAGFVVTFAGTYLLTKSKGYFTDDLYDFLTFNVFLTSAGAFILLKGSRSEQRPTIFARIRNAISKYGFSIYLSHPLVLNILTHFNVDYKMIAPAAGIPVTILICLTLSFMLVYVLSKLPGGRFISG